MAAALWRPWAAISIGPSGRAVAQSRLSPVVHVGDERSRSRSTGAPALLGVV